MKALLVCWVLLLAILQLSCDRTFDTEVHREYKKETVLITWHESSDLAPCDAVGKGLLACAFWSVNTCTIYTYPDPAMDTLGHEMLHCFAGRWHPNREEG